MNKIFPAVFFATLLSGTLLQAQQYVISTVAGIPTVQGYAGDGFPASNAQLTRPYTISVDSKSNYYIADIYTHTVRMVTASSGIISTVAGTGAFGFSGDNGPAVEAVLTDPHGMAADGNGNIYISDTSNSRVRKIDSKGTISTFAGSGTRGSGGDGSEAAKASLWFPAGLAIDGSGNLYVADYGNSTVRKITPSGAISTIAGTGSWGYSGDGGPAKNAALANPITVAVDSAGNVYVGDTGTKTIRKIGTDGNIITLLANVSPQSIAVDSEGSIYFVDPAVPLVKKRLPTGSVLALAGTGQPGYTGDGVPALTSQVNFPSGVAADASGRIYIADSGNQAIRLLTPGAFSVGAVTNSASSAQGAISPGEIVTLFGTRIGPPALTLFTPANGFIGTQLGGVSVTFNGIPAPLIYVYQGLIAAIAPYGLAVASAADIVVSYQGNTSATTTVPVAAAAPGIFTADSTGSGPAAAVNQDGTLNTAATPAKPGSFISLYVTGEGQTLPPGEDGKISTLDSLPKPVLPVTAQIGGVSAPVSYAGGAPTLVQGLMQVNVQIPATVPPGVQPVSIRVGNFSAQAGVTVAVGQ